MIIDVQPFPKENRHRAIVPCPVLSHIWRVHRSTVSLECPILWCPACNWTYEEVATDNKWCSEPDCFLDRVAGSGKCASHGAIVTFASATKA